MKKHALRFTLLLSILSLISGCDLFSAKSKISPLDKDVEATLKIAVEVETSQMKEYANYLT